MRKFNSTLFKRIITEYVNGKMEIGEEYVNTRTELYNIISKKIIVAPDTIRSWTREGSNGPNKTNLKLLTECLDIKNPDTLYTDNNSDEHEKEIITMNKLKTNDFFKSKIYKLNKKMISYFSKFDISDEDKFCKLETKIRKLKIALPPRVIEVVDNYFSEVLEPFVYEESANTDFGEYCQKVLSAERKWEELAEKELKPLLIG